MQKRRVILPVLLLIIMATIFTGCGASESASAQAGDRPKKVQELNLAILNSYWPVTYEDENGKPAGYAVELWQQIEKDWPEYKFNYVLTSVDDVMIGLETGTYDAAPGGWYYSDVRAEKFIYPKQINGGGIVGLILRNVDAAANKTFADAVANQLRFCPTPANIGFIGVIEQYNQEHPDAPIPIELSQEENLALDYQNIIDQRYDASIGNKHNFVELTEEKGRTDFKDALSFNSVTLIKAYDFFRKDHVELAAKYDALIQQYKENGFLRELAVKYFGEDLFALAGE
ncbi:MAG: transporter substrate-binding domain-containing protein [Peptococcaceae bacterium]|jgi:L-cystine transport system substrate-binding protein|nr:transporter substrate-binding domain-containing protein [Peptococcaceae bacterium]